MVTTHDHQRDATDAPAAGENKMRSQLEQLALGLFFFQMGWGCGGEVNDEVGEASEWQDGAAGMVADARVLAREQGDWRC